jgi:hypothetical protein
VRGGRIFLKNQVLGQGVITVVAMLLIHNNRRACRIHRMKFRPPSKELLFSVVPRSQNFGRKTKKGVEKNLVGPGKSWTKFFTDFNLIRQRGAELF